MKMNDNKPAIGRHDEFARSLCSERALTLIDSLPALLRHDNLDTLARDGLEAAENLKPAVAALTAFDMTGDFSKDDAEIVIRREYLARKSLEAYQGEIEIRRRDAGIH